MKTIHVMKTLNKALFAFVLIVPFLMANAAPAHAADETLANYQANPDGSYSITLPDGSQQTIPAALAAQISQALASGSDADLSAAIQNVVSTNAATNSGLAAAITGLATSLAPSRAGSIAVGGLLGAPNASDQILSTVANTPGVSFSQVVADVNNDPQIPPATKVASNVQLANIQPAAGGDTPPGKEISKVVLGLVADALETAENPAQDVATGPVL